MGGSNGRTTRRRAYGCVLILCLAPALVPALVSALAPAMAAAATANSGELQTALAARPDAGRGESLYGTCTACHGPDGGGVADGTIPAIAGQPQRVIVKQLADFRRNQRLDIRMEHFADRRHLEGAQDLSDVAAYVAGLQRRTATGIGDGQAVDAGARAWFGACGSCHGATGKADAQRLLPRLAGQHAGYLERQIFDTAAGRRPNMNHTHRRLFKGLSQEQVTGMADYLSRLN